MRISVFALAVLTISATGPALADSVAARCDIYPAGSDRPDRMIGCSFSQRQGNVTIVRDDNMTHDLKPVGDLPGNFVDQSGRPVYRQSGLGDQGQIFRLPDETVYVYWSTTALETADGENPTWPFTTNDYDATTLLRCRAVASPKFATCPAGVLRLEDGQASIVVQSQASEQFTINFMTGYVNATNRSTEAVLEGDTWTIIIDGREVYEVPLAAIEGG